MSEETNPSLDPLAAAKARSKVQFKEMLQLEGGCLTVVQMAPLLGLQRAAVNRRRIAGRLIGIPDPDCGENRDRYLYPAWQIHNGKLLNGLEEVLKILHEKELFPVSKFRFFLSACTSDLEERTPLQLLRLGKPADLKLVIKDAQAFLEQGAR